MQAVRFETAPECGSGDPQYPRGFCESPSVLVEGLNDRDPFLFGE